MRLVLALTALLVIGVGLDSYRSGDELRAMQAASDEMKFQVPLINGEGQKIGQAVLMQAARGVLIHVEAEGLPPGWHALHIHEYGACEAPKFESAGGHYNPTNRKHGYNNRMGYHADGAAPAVHAGRRGRRGMMPQDRSCAGRREAAGRFGNLRSHPALRACPRTL